MVESGDLASLANGIERGPTHVGNESPAGIIGLAPEKAGVTREENATAEAGRIIRQPMARAVAQRGRTGRPISSAPLSSPAAGQHILEAGHARATGEEFPPSGPGARGGLQSLIDKGVSPGRLEMHPAIREAYKIAGSFPSTEETGRVKLADGKYGEWKQEWMEN